LKEKEGLVCINSRKGVKRKRNMTKKLSVLTLGAGALILGGLIMSPKLTEIEAHKLAKEGKMEEILITISHNNVLDIY